MDTVRTEKITLQVGDGTTMNAYVASPAGEGKLPGLLVFQEAFGVNPHIRHITERFAKQGYVAIAADLFSPHGTWFRRILYRFPGGSCRTCRRSLRKACSRTQRLRLTGCRKIRVCYEFHRQRRVLHGRAGVVSRNSALPLRAAISFYGGGIAPALLSRAPQIHGPMLFFWGGLDSHIPQDQIRSVIEAMKESKKTYVNVEFSDADHGFFCDARASYKETAAKQAWDLSLRFLTTYVKSDS